MSTLTIPSLVPEPPDTSQDNCSVCQSSAAPFIVRDRNAGTVTRFCYTHVPDDWGMTKSLTRALEEAFIARQDAEGLATGDGKP